MDLDFNEKQLILKTAARDFLEAECPSSRLREIMAGEEIYAPELWEKVAALGWLSLIIPEKYGGADCTFLDFVTLLEEAGHRKGLLFEHSEEIPLERVELYLSAVLDVLNE